jgi:feruloyl esterase
MKAALLIGSTALAWTVWGQRPTPLREWTPELAGEPGPKPKLACKDLRSLTSYEFSVISATLAPATAEAPEHCRVSGLIQPEIRFQVNLPTAWNHRFYMFGNGGMAGEPMESPGKAAQRALAVRHGFAVADTNTGHDAATEPLASFAASPQKLIDYAFRSVHVTAETAKKLIQAYYGTPPRRSYFVGCSTGGRQGLTLAQRFPADFDGIVAGAPVLYMSAHRVAQIVRHRALDAAPLLVSQLKVLADRVYAQCDSKDGLADGLIDDPRRCGFRPARDLPKCAGDTPASDCFTPGQIDTLEKTYAEVMSRGKRIFPGVPVGAEIADASGVSGWDGMVRRLGTASVAYAESFFRYMAFPEKNLNYQLSSFDLDRDPPRLAWMGSLLDATDPDLARFRDRGGKLLMYHGWADAGVNPIMAIEYYESVLERMGPSTTNFARLFLVPGMFHCGGGVGTSSFDPVTAMIRWVEQGRAPAQLASARVLEGKVVRTRPLCPYPETAKYKGSGSIDEAASFRCAVR